ncbi:carbohydrate kinase family protein [Halodurantibacterium flavum]|uniref:Carbohydrate kinase n=1 Tax=Halodurantibacterium flavum TaxID=1382802 RepID=A0ABW4S9T0_9RHOB
MILCCGEALIDMLPRRTTADEPAFAPYPGGAVFNTAIALGRLGAPVSFWCGLSDDLFGTMLADALAASGVDISLCPRPAAPCTLAFVQLVDGQARYAFYDENTALRSLTPDALPPLPDSVQALFFGGISLVSEPCGSAFEAMMTRASGRVTMLDPNIRPGFVQDEPAYRARIDRMIALADIVKLSDEDLHWLCGNGDAAMLAQGLIARGPKVVVITEGARGATAHWAGEAVSVPGQRVEVVDTVGAGDTFNAGFLAALNGAGLLGKEGIAQINAETLRHALDLGARAAAVTVSRAGANPPWASELA